jgi:hypothetical protein
MGKDFRWALDQAEVDAEGNPAPRPDLLTGSPGDKKNYAQRLSRAIAWMIADALRPRFPSISPDEHGKRHEAISYGGKGPIKIDVNFSTPELGLALGVSVKTLNFVNLIKNKKTKKVTIGRYGKNYTRIDKELRSEAKDVHQRQPYAVLAGVVFLPIDCCDDAKTKQGSSFAGAVRCYLHRGGRQTPKNEEELFERMYVALYQPDPNVAEPPRGWVGFFDVMQTPPMIGRSDPAMLLTFDQFIQQIIDAFHERNPKLRM